MNRRSFFSRSIAALVVLKVAQDAPASPLAIPGANDPQPIRGRCACTYFRQKLVGVNGEFRGYAVGIDKPCEKHAEFGLDDFRDLSLAS